MGRISKDVTDDEDKKLKTLAALQELEELLDSRIQSAKAGTTSRWTTKEVFAAAVREKAK